MNIKKTIFSFCLIPYTLSIASAPKQVVILPSAEQNGTDLTTKGTERAQALAPYLINTALYSAAGPFNALFAAKPSYINKSFASQKTFIPLGNTLSLPVHCPYGVGQENLMADLILTSQQFEGKNIGIAWDHTSVNALLEAFGFTISTPYAGQSDVVFVLENFGNSSAASIYAQTLLYGDSPTIP